MSRYRGYPYDPPMNTERLAASLPAFDTRRLSAGLTSEPTYDTRMMPPDQVGAYPRPSGDVHDILPMPPLGTTTEIPVGGFPEGTYQPSPDFIAGYYPSGRPRLYSIAQGMPRPTPTVSDENPLGEEHSAMELFQRRMALNADVNNPQDRALRARIAQERAYAAQLAQSKAAAAAQEKRDQQELAVEGVRAGWRLPAAQAAAAARMYQADTVREVGLEKVQARREEVTKQIDASMSELVTKNLATKEITQLVQQTKTSIADADRQALSSPQASLIAKQMEGLYYLASQELEAANVASKLRDAKGKLMGDPAGHVALAQSFLQQANEIYAKVPTPQTTPTGTTGVQPPPMGAAGGQPAPVETGGVTGAGQGGREGQPDLDQNGIADEDEPYVLEADRFLTSKDSEEIDFGLRAMAKLTKSVKEGGKGYSPELIKRFIANNKAVPTKL